MNTNVNLGCSDVIVMELLIKKEIRSICALQLNLVSKCQWNVVESLQVTIEQYLDILNKFNSASTPLGVSI